jgi:hypothetical protein
MDRIKVPRIDSGMLFAGTEPSISIHLAISVLSADKGLTAEIDDSNRSWWRYALRAFLLCATAFFEERVLAPETGARVWKVLLPVSAFLCVLILNASDDEVLVGLLVPPLLSSEESSAYTKGATLDLPCFVSWFGSCTTKAVALPKVYLHGRSFLRQEPHFGFSSSH